MSALKATPATQTSARNTKAPHAQGSTHARSHRTATDSRSNSSAAQLLLHSAGPSFLLLGFFGRVPAAFNQLGMLLIVSAAGRGLAAAGAAVAIVGLGTAIGAPIIGRSVDRFGPVRVLLAALSVQVLALLGVAGLLYIDAPTPWILLCGGFLGGANPQAGSIARACWSGIARRDSNSADAVRIIRLGFGFETAADETSFVVGPVAAGLLVTFLGPLGATFALVIATIFFEGAFALWLARNQQLWVRESTRAKAAADPIPLARLAPQLVVIFAVGMVFGTTQTALAAVNEAAGNPALTGPMYGAMGVTSAIAGLISPSLPGTWSRKVIIGGVLVTACSLGFSTLPAPLGMLVLILVMGAGVGNTLSNSYTELESHAPSEKITTVMTIAATCLVLGVSSGSLLGGLVGGHLHWANTPAVVAGVLMILVVLLTSHARIRDRRENFHENVLQ